MTAPAKSCTGPATADAAEVPNESRPPALHPRRNRYALAEPLPGAQRKAAKPLTQSNLKTGAQLADMLEAWCERTGASKARLGLWLFASAQGLLALRRSKRPKSTTSAKVHDFLENPVPPDRLPERAKQRRFAPRVNPRPAHVVTTVDDAVRSERTKQRVKRSIRRQAQAAVDAGITPAKASPNAGVRGAMKEIVEHREAMDRANSPVEQAKRIIRSRGHNCFEAWVTLGDTRGRGKFFINNDLVNEAELLARAARIKAAASV